MKLSKRGRSWLVLLGSALGVVELVLVLSLHSQWQRSNSLSALVQSKGLAFYSALFLAFAPLLYMRLLGRQKRLLQNGEIAIATVKSRRRRGTTGPYYVSYRFRALGGSVIEGESLDSTTLLREGSSMLIYYSPDDMDDQVAQCAAYYEVLVPGFASDYVDEIG